MSPNQPTPSRTRSTVSVYAPPLFGVCTFALIVAAAPGATSAASGVRRPSHTTGVMPVASYQWYVRFTGFAPVAFQVWFPVFVSDTGICSVAPAGAVAGALWTVYVARYVAGCTNTLSGALGANHVMPSLTSAKRRRYWPGSVGATTVAVTVRRPCAGTSGVPSGVRSPSQTVAAPVVSYQW